MKKGLILYVTEGKEDVPPHGRKYLVEISQSLGVAGVCVVTTSEDVDYGWWTLVTRGVHQVLLMKVTYNNALEKFESFGAPLRLWG